jgi:tripartite-type tricarboxylate transporter receptor subunit TctC
MVTRRTLLACAALSPILARSQVFAPEVFAAESWPQRSVRIVVPFAAGGNTDGIARVIGQSLSDGFGQPFVIENKPGADGAIAAEAVKIAPADGYTLFMAALPQIAIFPAMTKVSYDPVKDFAPISNVGSNPFMLIVHPSFPAHDLGELVTYVRARPSEVTYASGGTGSLGHLSMALFASRAGLEMTHVPYKGGGPALADVIAGHVPLYFANLSEALPQAKAGTVRALAVSSEVRAHQIPDVPTVAESGYPGFRTVTWNGLMAPAATPKAIVEQLSGAVAKAVKDQGVSEKLLGYGVDPVGDDPQHFAATIATDIAAWSEAIRVAGVTLQ